MWDDARNDTEARTAVAVAEITVGLVEHLGATAEVRIAEGADASAQTVGGSPGAIPKDAADTASLATACVSYNDPKTAAGASAVSNNSEAAVAAGWYAVVDDPGIAADSAANGPELVPANNVDLRAPVDVVIVRNADLTAIAAGRAVGNVTAKGEASGCWIAAKRAADSTVLAASDDGAAAGGTDVGAEVAVVAGNASNTVGAVITSNTAARGHVTAGTAAPEASPIDVTAVADESGAAGESLASNRSAGDTAESIVQLEF
jgi:hypothetical protein